VFGWQVPAYPLPPDMEAVTIMRVVVRNGSCAFIFEKPQTDCCLSGFPGWANATWYKM